jgi:protein TonB
VIATWDSDRHRRQYLQGWAVSLLAHGAILAAAVTFIADLKFLPPEERFHWEVSMVEPPKPQAVPEPPRPQAQPTPSPAPPVEEAQPQPQQIVERVPQVVQRQVVETTPVRQITRTAAHVVIPTPVPAAQAVAQPAPAAVEAPAPTVTASPAPVSEAAARPIEHAAVTQLPVRQAPQTQMDYGWLMEALWQQVDRLKRYPHTARLNRWEGKVVIRAVVKADGHVVELTVEESSGHSVLDRDALEILKEASPLKLKHPLGQPQVVVHVPISYNLR